MLSLRPITSADMPKILGWRNKKDIRKWFFNSQVLAMKDQKKWYSAYENKDNDEMFIIQVDSVDIGIIAIYNIDKKNKKAEIGRLLIGEDEYRSKGYAYQAGKLLLKYAFNSLKMEKLYLNLFADNITAVNLYTKLGFLKAAILRKDIVASISRKDVIVMGLLKRNFEEKS